MDTYRFTEDGIEEAKRRVRKISVISAAAILCVVLGITIANGTAARPMDSVPFVVLGAGVLFLIARRTAAETEKVARSTEVRLGDDTIEARNSRLTISLNREDVVELGYLDDGLLIRPSDIRGAVQLKPQLDATKSSCKR